MTGAGRVQRLTVAEQSTLADADPGAYDAYLIARTVAIELMTKDERRAMPPAEHGDYLAEAMALNLRRNTSDEPRRSSLDRMIEAERMRQTAQQNHEGPMADTALILRAASFAAHKHRNQRRKDADASPYINHPLALARVLAEEGGVSDAATLCAALLHDTIEDTDTTADELRREFGDEVRAVVEEVTDDKALPKSERKRIQVEQAAHISDKAKRVKLADKICNLRDVARTPPADWSLERRREYFDWAKSVIDRLRGIDAGLEHAFDEAFAARP